MPGPNAERDARIAAAARLGQSHEALAREYGLSRPRISQIVAAANPRGPEEAQRQLIAERLRSRWDELEKIVRRPPIRTTSIGRTQFDVRTCSCPVKARTDRDHEPGCKVEPVLDMSAVVAAVKTQLSIESQYRALFGVDLAARPGPVLDERQLVMMAEIRAAQALMTRQAPVVPLAALPSGYATMSPAEQAEADMARRRAQVDAQRTIIRGELAP